MVVDFSKGLHPSKTDSNRLGGFQLCSRPEVWKVEIPRHLQRPESTPRSRRLTWNLTDRSWSSSIFLSKGPGPGRPGSMCFHWWEGSSPPQKPCRSSQKPQAAGRGPRGPRRGAGGGRQGPRHALGSRAKGALFPQTSGQQTKRCSVAFCSPAKSLTFSG